MQIFHIKGESGDSTIRVNERLQHLPSFADPKRSIIITDTNVQRRYGHYLAAYPVITIGTGEGIKTLATIETIFDQLVALEADRSSFIVGVGGGIVCDITGFAAATYMRGVDCGLVSSTLLAQVDASVGGKNGVNFRGYKNMMGVFRQPSWVICDLSLLKTLPAVEVQCGLAEIAKHAAISDGAMFDFMEAQAEAALALDEAVIERLVFDSVRIKADIVNQDEKEAGERRKLNFGHTFGHALEKVCGMPHGQAVAIGMIMAARLSKKMGFISPGVVTRMVALLRRLGLPTEMPATALNLIEALKKDKKRAGKQIHFVLLADIGQARVENLALTAVAALAQEFLPASGA